MVRKSTLDDPDALLRLDCLTLYVQDVPEPGGRGRFLAFFPPGDTQQNRASVDCKPGSVPGRVAAFPWRTIPLGPPLPTGSSALTRTLARRLARGRLLRTGHPARPYSSLLQKGFTSPPVTRLSRVGSYPTFSPLPPRPERRGLAVSFLWHCPSGCPGWSLSTFLPCGARTFLSRAANGDGSSPPSTSGTTQLSSRWARSRSSRLCGASEAGPGGVRSGGARRCTPRRGGCARSR